MVERKLGFIGWRLNRIFLSSQNVHIKSKLSTDNISFRDEGHYQLSVCVCLRMCDQINVRLKGSKVSHTSSCASHSP